MKYKDLLEDLDTLAAMISGGRSPTSYIPEVQSTLRSLRGKDKVQGNARAILGLIQDGLRFTPDLNLKQIDVLKQGVALLIENKKSELGPHTSDLKNYLSLLHEVEIVLWPYPGAR